MGARTKRLAAAAAALTLAATAAVVGLTTSGGAAAATVPRLQAFAIVNNGTLMAAFWTDRPEQNDWVRLVTGLSGDTALIGIDMRVQDGKLYGVGNHGGIYTIGIPSAALTKVSQLTVPLYGTKFGVDFNPAADRLRIVSDNGQNLRHNLNDGTTVEDGTLTTPPATGPTRGVTGAAYTNNDLNGATATTLFVINPGTDQVLIQSPANNGLLAATGSLGVDATGDVGFDIFSSLSGGRAVGLSAFASLPDASGLVGFYGVDPLTGHASKIGTFPLPVNDFAIALDGYSY